MVLGPFLGAQIPRVGWYTSRIAPRVVKRQRQMGQRPISESGGTFLGAPIGFHYFNDLVFQRLKYQLTVELNDPKHQCLEPGYGMIRKNMSRLLL
jgi:hypothetical protein